ncbi:MAG TPA: GAF domain-containing protein [Pyrinomonadaceae bacterium]|nr:GAF domain-containing protein [Pyrinomonadaceae bacterium]
MNDDDARKRAEVRLQTQYAVTRALSESDSLREAAPNVLRAVCESLGWEVGALWRVDREAGLLHCVEVWHVPGLAVAGFEEISRSQSFEKGAGLPGHVWEKGEPARVTDMAGSDFLRAPFAEREGLHGAFAFPVILRDETLGVMEFFSREPRDVDEDVLHMMYGVGSQIGQFMERRQAEEELRRLYHEREQEIEEISTPIVPVWRGVLVLPIVGTLDTRRMQRATQAALGEVARTGAHSCIIDITGARIADSHAVANLGNLVAALKLVGAEAIVTGVTAHAAHTLVTLGVDFTGMKTRRTLAEALSGIIKSQTRTQADKDGNSSNGTT